jgi:hypothetical protein
MNEQQKKRLMSQIAEDLIPEDVNLWPEIRQRCQASGQTIGKGTYPMNSIPAPEKRLSFLAVFILAFSLVTVTFFITPQGRAWAQEILHFFTRAESDSLPAPEVSSNAHSQLTPGTPQPTQTPGPTPTLLGIAFSGDCGDLRSPTCTLAQIQSKVRFTVKELGKTPQGMHFAGATGGPESVWLLYETTDQRAQLWIGEEPWTGRDDQKSWRVGASAVVETVVIQQSSTGTISGEYVQGSFGYRSGDAHEFWDANAPIQSLFWVENGIYFLVQYSGLPRIERDSLVALAGSLRMNSVIPEVTPAPPSR